MLDAVPDALVVVDAAGCIVEANAAAEALFGWGKAQLVGLNLCLLTSAGRSGRQYSVAALERWGRSANGGHGREVKILHRELGCVRAWLRIRALPGAPDRLLLAFSGLREQRPDAAAGLRERHLAHIVESAEDGIVSVDAEQRIVVFNRGAEEMFGYAASDIIGRRLEILLPKRFRRRHGGHIAAFASSNRNARRMGDRSEVVARRKNGEEFTAEASIMRFDLGGRTMFTAVIRDVSDRKRLEQELAESERRFRTIFDHTYQFVGLLHPDGTIVEINQTALTQAEVALADVVGRPFWDSPWWRFSAESRAAVKDAIGRAAAGQFVRYTVDIQGSSEARTIDLSLMPVFDESGRVVSIIPEARDISELMRATAALRLSEARLAKAQRIARLGYFDWTAESGTTYWSEGIYRILGLPKREANSFTPSFESLLNCVHVEDRKMVADAIQRALNADRAFNIHHRVVRPDGTERIIHAQAEVTLDDAGQPTRIAGMAQDVTESKRVEQALRVAKEEAEHANRAKSTFLANMSHELRTPLNAVIGFAEMMELQTFGPLNEAYLSYTRDIHESGRHLLDIINDILDMSKIEAGQQQMHESDVSLPAVIAAMLRLVSVRAKAAGLDIRVRLPSHLPLLHADERLIKQILLNLLSNAVKFTPAGGQVTVAAAIGADDALSIAVADTGIGMSAEGIPTALEPFGQIDSAMSRKFQGTGLGLPLVKSLAELHGGTLSIESALGAGTTVTAHFPPFRTRRTNDVADIEGDSATPDAPAAHAAGVVEGIACTCGADLHDATHHASACTKRREG